MIALVTPLAGVWIEIVFSEEIIKQYKSLPLRECGLKCLATCRHRFVRRHSPCGSVD